MTGAPPEVRRLDPRPLAAVVVAALAGAFILEREGPGGIDTWDVLETLVGWAFVGSGAYIWQRRPGNQLGTNMVIVGSVWLLGRVLRQFSTSLAWSSGIFLGDLWSFFFVWVLLAFPSGVLRGALDWSITGVMFVFAGPLEVAWLLFWPGGGEPRNYFAVFSNQRVADDIDSVQRAAIIVATVLAVYSLTRRWLRASRPLRWALVPALIGAVSLVVGGTANVLAKFDVAVPVQVQWTLEVTLVMVPIAVMAGLLRLHLARANLAHLVLDLQDSPSMADLRGALAQTLGDPTLEIAYWLPKYAHYAAADGQAVEIVKDVPGRAATFIERNGRQIAVVQHDATLTSEPALLDAVTAAAGMALENGQLQAELKARLEELEGSRARVVEAGRAERKRLERNLHDGTQQRLIVLSMELAALERGLDDPETRTRVQHARSEVAASLGELREVASGLYPAVLSLHGLAPALTALARRAAVPVELTVRIEPALPEHLEVVVYYVVSESLANIGKHAAATSAIVEVDRTGGEVSIDITDDGVGGADLDRGSGLQGLADRLDAVGGNLRVDASASGGTRIRATMPCEVAAAAAP